MPASQTAVAVLELQRKLPKARIAYASATAATEPENLGYCSRLGLWGVGTAFPDAKSFVRSISCGGVSAMELVARDMKSMGLYVSRNLGFEGVEYDRVDHILTPDQREMYDKLCHGWQVVLANFNEALALTASKKNKGGDKVIDGKVKSRAMAAFWGSHQRFFNYIVTSMSLPTVIKDMERELADGNCCVLQLVNTNEAAMERQLAKAVEEESDLDDIDLTPKDQLLQLVEHCFPTVQHEEIEDESGKRMQKVTNSKGEVVHNKEALRLKNQLLDELASIRLVPDGPMEMIISHFGPDNVAEVTGRKRRVVRVNGNTVTQTRSQSKCVAEVSEFQAGKRRILIFSDAGGTGASYHASRKVENQSRRIHYLIQPGWIAAQAIQGFGRTHRSDQVCPPKYKLVSTDLRGQARFVSSIARRLDQLGALTKGERKSARNMFSRETDNLESPYAKEALYLLYRDVFGGRVDGLSLKEFQDMTGLVIEDKEGRMMQSLPPIQRFLNRLLSLQIEKQNALFDHYMARFESVIANHIANNTLDCGTEVIRADRIEKVKEQVVYTDPKTQATTKLVELSIKRKNHPLTWDNLTGGGKEVFFKRVEFFARNHRSGQLWAFTAANDQTNARTGSVERYYRQIGVLTHHSIPAHEVDYGQNWEQLETTDELKSEWDMMVAKAPEYTTATMFLIVGLTLPIFDRLKGDVRVKRLQVTDTKEQLLGREIQQKALRETLEALGIGADTTNYSAEELVDIVKNENRQIKLVNGWTIKQTSVSYARRIELVGPNYADRQWLLGAGLLFERINYTPKWLFPESEKAVDVLAEIIRLKPVASVIKERDHVDSGDME